MRRPVIYSRSASICTTMSPRGKDALLKAAKFLAMTGYDYLTSAELRERVREAFQKRE